jgi:hypothetical protein
MKIIAHYLKPRKNGAFCNKPWAPRATRTLSLPALPRELIAYYEQHDHSYEFVLNDIVFFTGAELEKQRSCAWVSFARKVHSKRKVYVYDTNADVVITPDGEAQSYRDFLLEHRPHWADYK